MVTNVSMSGLPAWRNVNILLLRPYLNTFLFLKPLFCRNLEICWLGQLFECYSSWYMASFVSLGAALWCRPLNSFLGYRLGRYIRQWSWWIVFSQNSSYKGIFWLSIYLLRFKNAKRRFFETSRKNALKILAHLCTFLPQKSRIFKTFKSILIPNIRTFKTK